MVQPSSLLYPVVTAESPPCKGGTAAKAAGGIGDIVESLRGCMYFSDCAEKYEKSAPKGLRAPCGILVGMDFVKLAPV